MGLFSNKDAAPSGPVRPIQLQKDPTGAPAVDLTKVRQDAPSLAKFADKVGIELSKRDLSGIRAQVVALLDRSGSMRHDYTNGNVEQLLTRALGFALQVDADGKIPVIPFDDQVYPEVEVTQANFATIVPSTLNTAYMGSTNLAGALERVKGMAERSDLPLYVLVLTDGNPDSKADATRVVCELASYAAFIKILALREVPYLQELDDLDSSKRLVDNVDAKPESGSGVSLLSCSDMEFAAAMVDEWDSWFAAATAAGIVKA